MKKLIIASLCIIPALAIASQYTPTSEYMPREILGWQVLVNKELINDHPALAEKVTALLQNQLYLITRVVPKPALVHLRNQKIRVEYKDKNFP